MTRPVLYGYWRSSCTWRVRIALHLKNIEFEMRPVNLLEKEHRSEGMAEKLPFSLVPGLVHNGVVLAESMAIMEYLEEKYPDRRTLLPGSPEDRARIRSLCLQIVANTQPLQNLGVLEYLAPSDQAKRQEWASHWIERGFTRLERELTKCAGKFAYGDQLTMLDCCIPPQVYNAKRFGVDVATKFPTIERIDRQLAELPEFQAADALNQPDTPPELKKN